MMRGLTVRQPWAWAIIHGSKDVENRTRNIAGAYRGPLLIQAGLLPVAGAETPQGRWPLDVVPMAAWQPRGAIIGVVDLVDVHHHDPSGLVGCYCSPWAQPFETHLVLANPRPLARPIPWRGQLGLWRVPDALDAAIREQVDLGMVG